MGSGYVDDLVENYPSPVKHYDQVTKFVGGRDGCIAVVDKEGVTVPVYQKLSKSWHCQKKRDGGLHGSATPPSILKI